MGTRALATVTAFLLLVATQFVLATSAMASGTVTRSGGVLTLTAGPGEVNVVTVEASGDAIVFRDSYALFTDVASGCASLDANTLSCPAAGLSQVELRLGDGNDTSRKLSALPVLLVHDGGQGDDTATAMSVADGADRFVGGGGTDTVSYETRTRAVQVDGDGQADDGQIPVTGEFAEGDDVGSDVEVVIGGAGADVLIGSPANNRLDGGAGADTVFGRDGHDTLVGGIGNDQLVAETAVDGDDVFQGGAGIDRVLYAFRPAGVRLSLNGSPDDGQAGAERDTIATDVEQLTGTGFDDLLIGSAAANDLVAAGGNDRVFAGAGNDTVDLGPGTDVYVAEPTGDGADSVIGGGGIDLADYTLRNVAVTIDLDDAADDGAVNELDNLRSDLENVNGGGGGDRITGDADANVITGGLGGDTLAGGNGNDVVDGGSGDDVLLANSTVDGADDLRGGAGVDWVVYRDRTVPVTVYLDGFGNDGQSGEGDLVRTDVENVAGGSGNDGIVGSAAANRLVGGFGDDIVDGAAGDDVIVAEPTPDGADRVTGGDGIDIADYGLRTAPVTVAMDGNGHDGAPGEGDRVGSDFESLLGGSGGDYLAGAGGNDRLDGRGGNDTLDGGTGDDVLLGGDGNDRIRAGWGNDVVDGGTGVDDLDGDDDNDTVLGGEGNDVILDRDYHADLVDAGGGDDLIKAAQIHGVVAGYCTGGCTSPGSSDYRGGAGADTIMFTDEAQIRIDGFANDHIHDFAQDNVRTDIENIIGSQYTDELRGSDAANHIDAMGGNDVVYGLGGDDALFGGAGYDTIDGGAGADTCSVEPGGGAITGC